MLEIRDLHVSIEGKPILKGVHLNIPKGESHAIMGPNGSGKSTLSYVLMGHPHYQVTSGDMLFEGESVLDLPTHERVRKGLFLLFQYPTPIPGVTVSNLLKSALESLRGKEIPFREFRKKLKTEMDHLGIEPKFAGRYVNDGFSGGEKKRNEILQMSLIQPKLTILDEIDSGLDIDALRIIAKKIEASRSPNNSSLVITHYQRLLNYLTVDQLHIFMNGRILKSGKRELAEQLEQEGYDWVKK